MDYDQAMFLFGGSGKGSLIRFTTPMPGIPSPEENQDSKDNSEEKEEE